MCIPTEYIFRMTCLPTVCELNNALVYFLILTPIPYCKGCLHVHMTQRYKRVIYYLNQIIMRQVISK